MIEHLWEDLLELGPECHERFLNQENVPELEALGIGFAGVSHFKGQYWVARKQPDYHTVLFTVEGCGKLITKAGEQLIEPNTLTLLPAGQPFHFSLYDDNWSTAWFCLNNGKLWQHLLRQLPGVSYNNSAHAIYHLLCQLYYEPEKRMREAPVKQLQVYLSQNLGEHTPITSKQTDQLRRLEVLFGDAQEQLHYPWTIEGMAERVHYSAPHLHKLCQRIYNQSPMQKLIQLRMERAKHLLVDTNWSLIEIASSVGYQDAFNFSNRFKKSVGIAPSKYRQSMHRR